MKLFSKFFLLSSYLVSAAAGAAGVELLGNASERTHSFKIEDRPLAAALDELNSAYGLEVRLDDARWRDLPVTSTIAGSNVSVMIKALLRDYDFVLQREDSGRWLLSIYGPISPRRPETATGLGWTEPVRTNELIKATKIEAGWIELEGPDGSVELIRDPASTSRDDVAGTESSAGGDIKPAWIELEGPDGVGEFIRAQVTAPENSVTGVVSPAGFGGRSTGWIELQEPDGLSESIRVPEVSSAAVLKETPSSVEYGNRQSEWIALEGPDGVGEIIRASD